jgi:hypothetical protein
MAIPGMTPGLTPGMTCIFSLSRLLYAVKRAGLVFLVLAACALPLSAHVGSPDVFLEGNAGPYKLFVTVRVPQVIPGVAEIEIRSESSDLTDIRIAPMQLTGPGSQYPPAPEAAARSKDDPQFFQGNLWLMEFGSLQVRIQADGAQGKGLLAVPIPAVAQRMLPMRRSLGLLLFALMTVLALAMVLIVAAAVREGNLAPGAVPTPTRKRRVPFAAAIASLVVIGVLTLGALWWRADARQYASHIYSPPEIEAVVNPAGQLVLHPKSLRVASGNPRRPANLIDFSDLILDHDHLMHLFVMSSPGMNSFWHLHPQRGGADTFIQNLPAMPPGHYQIFADVVLNSGFPVTMLGQIDLPSAIPGTPLTGDDSGVAAAPISLDPSPAVPASAADFALSDGAHIIWQRDPQSLRAGVPLALRFHVTDPAGNPAQDLQPYMGMAAHAEIVRSDYSVFAHIHPTGSVPMASYELAQASLPGNAGFAQPSPTADAPNMPNMPQMAAVTVSPDISLPYGFPQPGLYRIFIQVKRSGRIDTAFFDAPVN